MTAKKLKALAPAFWQAVEDGVYADCVSNLRHYSSKKLKGLLFGPVLTDEFCRTIAYNAAFIATSEWVSRVGK